MRIKETGRMVNEGAKNYTYGWLDKVLKVSDNNGVLSEYTYFNSGQLANATHNPVAGDNNAMTTETFVWDGLALIDRNGTSYINEPHAGGGNPVLAINGVGNTQAIFNDVLGTSVGNVSGSGYSAIEKTTFGYNETNNTATTETNFYTGKPNVRNLGYVFLIRNYRSDLSKWQTEDPLGYPDGWNNFAYVNNMVTMAVDLYGTWTAPAHHDINEYLTKDSEPTWGGVSYDATSILNGASDSHDSILNQSQEKAYEHGMRKSDENGDGVENDLDRAVAEIKWENFITSKVNEAKELSDLARENKLKSTLDNALKSLGIAIHAYADYFSPSHLLSVWNPLDLIGHLRSETYEIFKKNYRNGVSAKVSSKFLSDYNYIIQDYEKEE